VDPADLDLDLDAQITLVITGARNELSIPVSEDFLPLHSPL
jgi:hypothetical protein